MSVGEPIRFVEPTGWYGTTVMHGLRCSTCGHTLTVPLFHPGQAEITDHHPTVDVALVDLASPEAEKALAEALDSYRGECSDPEFHRDTARAILATWREKL